MTNEEIIRIRRQMQRRIRAVLEERRTARTATLVGGESGQDTEPGTRQRADG